MCLGCAAEILEGLAPRRHSATVSLLGSEALRCDISRLLKVEVRQVCSGSCKINGTGFSSISHPRSLCMVRLQDLLGRNWKDIVKLIGGLPTADEFPSPTGASEASSSHPTLENSMRSRSRGFSTNVSVKMFLGPN